MYASVLCASTRVLIAQVLNLSCVCFTELNLEVCAAVLQASEAASQPDAARGPALESGFGLGETQTPRQATEPDTMVASASCPPRSVPQYWS